MVPISVPNESSLFRTYTEPVASVPMLISPDTLIPTRVVALPSTRPPVLISPRVMVCALSIYTRPALPEPIPNTTLPSNLLPPTTRNAAEAVLAVAFDSVCAVPFTFSVLVTVTPFALEASDRYTGPATPIPPLTTNAPLAVLPDVEVDRTYSPVCVAPLPLSPPMYKLPLTAAPPCTWNAPDVRLLAVAVLLANTAPPDTMFLAELIPPATENAPVVVDVASSVPASWNAPLTLMLPPIPTPPVTTNAPDVVEVDAVDADIVNGLFMFQRLLIAPSDAVVKY